MGDNVIEVRNLGKKYVIQHERERYQSLRDTIVTKTKEIIHPSRKIHTSQEEFWALKDVSFDIKQGERVGIIGRNGAGKSTLLKVMSQITEPSRGSIRLKGRVASLLEVGTGFHPELTGRENIYLNGAIIGMSKSEIKSKFDEIVDFAGVEKFLDTPVKRYSSGMYVRLAFAVSAHLEPEILIVDEVLAVGDMQFQQKCIGKMSQIGNEGRTVLFVSHNMAAIQSLCNRGIVLDRGEVAYSGKIGEAIGYYLENKTSMNGIKIRDRKDRKGNQKVKIEEVKFYNGDTLQEVDTLLSGMPILIAFEYYCEKPEEIKKYEVHFGISHPERGEVIAGSNQFTGQPITSVNRQGVVYCKIKKWPLNKGIYNLRFYTTANGEEADILSNACEIVVEYGDYYGTGVKLADHLKGVLIEQDWEKGELIL